MSDDEIFENQLAELERAIIEDIRDSPSDEEDESEVDIIEARDQSTETEQSGQEDDGSTIDQSNNYICRRRNGSAGIETFLWDKSFNSHRHKRYIVPPSPRPGLKGQALSINSIESAWSCLFTDIDLEKVVDCTNEYIRSTKSLYARERDCKTTDLVEFKALLGLLYISGLYKAARLNIDDLWSDDCYGIEIFRLSMNKQRFRFLLRSVRLDSLSTRDENQSDKLRKVRAFFETFILRSKENYSPEEVLTVDEQLVAFRGRCSFRQYIPSKPAKYGLKIFLLTETKNYYTYHAEIYAGKNSASTANSGYDVLLRMVECIEGTGRTIVADNWFTDIRVAETFARRLKLHFVGTVRRNKWNVPNQLEVLTLDVDASTRPMRRLANSTIWAHTKFATLASYVPKNKSSLKTVLLLSTLHRGQKIDQSSGTQQKPEAITFYNQHKIGVDIADKLCSLHDVTRTTKRWTMTIFYSTLNLGVINAQVLYEKSIGGKISRRNFIQKLADSLLRQQLIRRAAIPSLPRSISQRLQEFNNSIQSSELQISSQSASTRCGGRSDVEAESNISTEELGSQLRNARKRCRLCYDFNKKTSLTQAQCTRCNIYLCRKHTIVLCRLCDQQCIQNTSD